MPTESQLAVFQTMVYGGKVVILKEYDHRCALMKECVRKYGCHPVSSYTPSPTGDPFSQEGSKTIAYEICQDLDWQAPDKVIVPTGQGFCLHGIWKGFQDFYRMGLIDALPSMIAGESSSGGSFTKTRDARHIRTVEPKAGLARHAVAPKGSYKGYRAIVDSNGSSVMVTDQEVLEAVYALARSESVFARTTSAVAIAALKGCIEEQRINGDETVVCVVTAGGIKDADLLLGSSSRIPNAIEAGWNTMASFLKEEYDFTF
jgi:threonine synthase